MMNNTATAAGPRDSTRKHTSHPPGRIGSIRPNRLLDSNDLSIAMYPHEYCLGRNVRNGVLFAQTWRLVTTSIYRVAIT